jgi:hypothetical protein
MWGRNLQVGMLSYCVSKASITRTMTLSITVQNVTTHRINVIKNNIAQNNNIINDSPENSA